MSLRNTLILGQAMRRQMSTVQDVPSKGFKRLKEVQAKYGIEDGVPSYLKGGLPDRILFGTTVVMTGVALVMAGDVLYKLTYPPES